MPAARCAAKNDVADFFTKSTCMQSSDTYDLSLRDLLSMLRRSWVVIAVLTVVGATTAGIVAHFMRPVYRAEVLLSPAVPQGGQTTLSRLAEQFAPIAGIGGVVDGGGGLAGPEVSIATLKSRWLTESFIRQGNLMPLLFPEKWDEAGHRWKSIDGRTRAPAIADAVDLFDRIRTVSLDRSTGLVTLAIEWRNPQLAADWANGLVSLVNQFLRERAIDQARRSIDFLQGELGDTKVVERQQIIYGLIESQTSEIMLANARKEYAFVVVDPAVAPLPTKFVRPRRRLLTAIGAFLGLLMGMTYAGMRWHLSAGLP